ncbi:DUF2142 domain-containing protein, partial [Actinomyces slackii]|uniref:DUF2142 domain-containing protein n=1 Tax=Actinomyces slackii TaxID=52774 RepID=UPI0039E921F3
MTEQTPASADTPPVEQTPPPRAQGAQTTEPAEPAGSGGSAETAQPAEAVGAGQSEEAQSGPQVTPAAPVAGSRRGPLGVLARLLQSRGSRWAASALLIVAVLATGLSWALASPVGGSPDDDFHLGSIWCPRPVESSGCATRVVEGELRVEVPQRVSETARCYAFHEEISASCQGSVPEGKTIYTRRYDDGNYPTGYYRFHHLLIGDDVDESALVMRGANLLIAMALLGAIGWALPARLRSQYALSIILAWMPMGLYLVVSNNPSSWALTGVLAYAAGLYGTLRAEGRRRWSLLGLGLVGAVMACACRGDSAFYLLVVSLAVLIGARLRRGMIIPGLAAAVVSAIGAWMMLGSGQSAAVASSSPQPSVLSDSERLRLTIATLPEYLAGFWGWGQRWGAGWFDVPLDGPTVVIALSLAGFALFAGARALDVRTVLSAGVMTGALLGLPVVLSYTQGFESIYELQPRYLLPLLAPFLLIWLRRIKGEAVLTGPQATLLVGMSALAHAYALHRILLRYTHGLHSVGKDDAGWMPMNLNFQPQWWWDIPISPMAVWALGSLMYAVALVAALMLVRPCAPEASSAL